MSYGTLVDVGEISNADGEVSIGRHTDAIFIHNKNTTTAANVKLNGQFTVYIPATPSSAAGVYIKVPGDYTKIQVTNAVSIAYYAVG